MHPGVCSPVAVMIDLCRLVHAKVTAALLFFISLFLIFWPFGGHVCRGACCGRTSLCLSVCGSLRTRLHVVLVPFFVFVVLVGSFIFDDFFPVFFLLVPYSHSATIRLVVLSLF